MNKRRILILGLAMIVLLGLLAAGLQPLEFRAGLPVPDPGGPETGGTYVLPFPYALLERLLDLMPWLCLLAVILGAAIFWRKLFSEFARVRILISLLLILAVLGLRPWLNQSAVYEEDLTEVEEKAMINPPELWQPAFPSPDWVEDPAREQPVTLPGWVTYLTAAALALPLVWLGWWLARRAARRYRKGPPEESLREAAARAAAELRAGASVEEVVIRCWARMAEILARTAGGNAPPITARELAQLLAKRGVRDQAIVELTRLFEEVRYGDKADAPRRERALAALEAIEEAYGTA